MTEIDEAPTPVLPRELTEISDAVRAVGAPPTPALADPYRFRLVDPEADAELISAWMNRPHLVEAWEYDWPPVRWQRYVRAQLDGEYSRPFIGSFRGKDFGYIELTAPQRIPLRRGMTPIRMTSGCTPRSRI